MTYPNRLNDNSDLQEKIQAYRPLDEYGLKQLAGEADNDRE